MGNTSQFGLNKGKISITLTDMRCTDILNVNSREKFSPENFPP